MSDLLARKACTVKLTFTDTSTGTTPNFSTDTRNFSVDPNAGNHSTANGAIPPGLALLV